MRLRPKITIGILSILLTTLFIAGSLFIREERQRYLDQIRTAGTEMATLVAEFCSLPIQKFSFFIVEEVARNVEASPQVAFCEIYDQNGESLLSTQTRVLGQDMPKKERRIGPEVMVITHPIRSETDTIGQVEIGFHLEQVHGQLRQYALHLGISVAAMLVIVALTINLFLSLSFISPVVHLSQAARSLAGGDFVEIAMETRRDEIGGLARSFNQMSNSLKQLYQGLEQRVTERTAELEAANRQLQQEIADRRRVQSELHAAKEAAERANAYKSAFIANVSHEIRTPLNAILGYSQILQRRANLDDEARRYIDTIEGSGTHLLGLINDILDLSKIEAGTLEIKTEAFDLSALVIDLGTMFELHCSQKALFWAIEGIDPTIPVHVSGDAGKLRQVLINLLDNALKFTASGGITLRILPRGGDRFRFEVADTGRGLSSEDRHVIFDPFTQAKPVAQGKAFTQVTDAAQASGAGLGLAISRRFVELMGGRLGLTSQAGQGACFHFELSLVPAEPAGKARSAEGAALYQIVPGDGDLTAVVADDDVDNRSYLATVLEEGGLTVHTAANGLETLKVVAEARPDIVFLDHYMPILNGPQTLLRLRSRPGGERIKIVLVTAAAITNGGKPPETLDVDATLLKPFKVQEVFDCLVALLKVKLITSRQAASTEASLPADLALEPHLHKRLLETAEYGQVTALKRLIEELESGVPPQAALGRRLRMLLNRYDLDAIVTLLKSVTASPSSDRERSENPL